MEKILVAIENKENQKLLRNLLGKKYNLEIFEKLKIKNIDFDLIILDGKNLKEFKNDILKIKKKVSPLFLPVLLITPAKYVKISKNQLWKIIDDILNLPVEKIELEARIKNLLMARNLSLKLKEHMVLNLRAILYSIGDGVISTDKKGKIQMLNPQAEELTGWKEEEAKGKDIESVFKIINEYTRKKAENPIKRVLREGIVIGLANHTILISRDGKEIPISDSGAPIIGSDGKIMGAVFVFRDQTKERELQKEIEEAKKFSEGILETAREPLLVLNGKLEVIYANKSFYDIFKIKEEETIGKKIYDIGNREWDIPELKKLLEDILPKNTHFDNYEVKKEFKNVGEKIMVLNARRLLKEGEKTNFILLAMEDITKRKQAEEKLKESEEKYRLIFENSADVIYIIDTDFKFVDVSPSIKYWLGYKPEELVGKRFTDLSIIEPEYTDTLIKETKRVFKGEKIYSVVFPVITKEGKRKWAEVNAVPLYKNGKIVGEIAIGRDITKRVQAEIQARESEERYFKLMDNLNVGVMITDEEGNIFYYNNAIINSLGYKKEEFKKIKNSRELYFNPEERNIIIEKLKKDGYVSNYEVLAKGKDGKSIEILLNIFPIRYANNNCLQSIIYDVTEIKRKEAELITMKERYEAFFMNDLTGDFICTHNGDILTCNPSFLKIFGFPSLEDLPNKNINFLLLNPNIGDEICSMLKNKKKIENLEIRMKKIDGTQIDILANLMGIFDEKGNLTQIIGYLLDETRRKELEANLRQAQTLESLGTLAGGIAHDFNNILNIILGHSELLQRTYNPSSCLKEHQDYIKAILDSSRRGISLVKQLLTFSRKTEPEISPCNINNIIIELQKLAYETFPRYIKINLNLKENLPIILCDGNQIHQAILNLLVNSRDALPKGGEINIRTDIISGSTLIERFPDATLDDYILIEVSDNGVGMDENTLKNIFLPFFTTKELGKGTGLGLSLVYAIVKNHNGFIDVKSILGLGTTFKIYIPIKKEVPLQYQEEKKYGEILPGEGRTILIIEDEEMLIKLLENVLKEKDYNVLCAMDGEKGVEIFEKNKEKISCVICDLGLPVLSGDEVIKKIKNLKKDVKTILVSGLLDSKQKAEFTAIGVDEIVQKPYQIDELLYVLSNITKR